MLKDLMKHAGEFRRALRNFKFERVGNGLILFPAQKLYVGGVFEHDVNGLDLRFDPNLVVFQGLDDILKVSFNQGTQKTTWYIAPFAGDVTPVNTWTAANYAANSTELTTQYDEATRQEFVETDPTGAQSLNNLASKATFTINTNVTLYGAGLLSSSVKGGTAGVLFAATRFASSRALVDDDLLNIGYTISAASA